MFTPGKKCLRKELRAADVRSRLNLLEKDVVETFEEVFEEVSSLGLTVSGSPRLTNAQRANVDRNA